LGHQKRNQKGRKGQDNSVVTRKIKKRQKVQGPGLREKDQENPKKPHKKPKRRLSKQDNKKKKEAQDESGTEIKKGMHWLEILPKGVN